MLLFLSTQFFFIFAPYLGSCFFFHTICQILIAAALKTDGFNQSPFTRPISYRRVFGCFEVPCSVKFDSKFLIYNTILKKYMKFFFFLLFFLSLDHGYVVTSLRIMHPILKKKKKKKRQLLELVSLPTCV